MLKSIKTGLLGAALLLLGGLMAVSQTDGGGDSLHIPEWKDIEPTVAAQNIFYRGDTLLGFRNDTLFSNKGLMVYQGRRIYLGHGSGRDGWYRSFHLAAGQVILGALLSGAMGQDPSTASENAESLRDQLDRTRYLFVRKIRLKGSGSKRNIQLTMGYRERGSSDKYICNLLLGLQTGEVLLQEPPETGQDMEDMTAGNDSLRSVRVRKKHTAEQEDSIRREDISGMEYDVSADDSVKMAKALQISDSARRSDSTIHADFRRRTDSLPAEMMITAGDTVLALVGDTIFSNKGFTLYPGQKLYVGKGSKEGRYRFIRWESKRRSPMANMSQAEISDGPVFIGHESLLEADMVKEALDTGTMVLAIKAIRNVDVNKKRHAFLLYLSGGEGAKAFLYQCNIAEALAAGEILLHADDLLKKYR